MNCHGQADSTQENGHKKHGSWLMWCCIIPMVLVGGALLLGYRGALTGLLSLLCPIMMVGMMFMGHGSKRQERESPADSHEADHSATL